MHIDPSKLKLKKIGGSSSFDEFECETFGG